MIVKKRFYKVVDNYKFTKDVKEVSNLNLDLVKFPCYMFLDQATKTGISIFDFNRRLIATVYIEKEVHEAPIDFRHKLKAFLSELIDEFQVFKLFSENVYDGVNFSTVETLLSIKTMLEDLAFEKKIKYYSIDNAKWKSRLSYPATWVKSIDDKKQINHYVSEFYPNIKVEQDVIDSLGIGISVLFKTTENMRPLEMKLNKKLPIEKEVFIVCSEDEMFRYIENSRFMNTYKLLGYKLFDYDTTLDLDTNFKYILTNYNTVAVCKIPYHKYYGQILLQFNIKPSQIPDSSYLVGIARRKRWDS